MSIRWRKINQQTASCEAEGEKEHERGMKKEAKNEKRGRREQTGRKS